MDFSPRRIFEGHMKKKGEEKIGIELELPCFEKATGKPASFSSVRGIEVLLKSLAKCIPATPIEENGHILGLQLSSQAITLEPGAQVEISTPPSLYLEDQQQAVQACLGPLQREAEKLQLCFLPLALQPFAAPPEIEWIPKARYAIMAPYLQERGYLAHWMMKATASLQISIDFCDEEDARMKFLLAQSLIPFFTAISAASPFVQGHRSLFKSFRGKIWWFTDPARCRLVKPVYDRESFFDAYTRYAEQVPMMFLKRGDAWFTPPPLTFSEYSVNGWENFSATEEDWILHLNGLFPPVRLREYIEIRCFDALPLPLGMGVLALIKGLFYSSALDRAAEHFLFPFPVLLHLYKKVWREGVAAGWRGYVVREGLERLFQLARDGLQELSAEGRSSKREADFLEASYSFFQHYGTLSRKMLQDIPESFTFQDISLFYKEMQDARALSV